MVLGGSRCTCRILPPGRERCPLVVPEPRLSRVAASHLLNATWGDWSFSACCWEDRWRGHGTFWRADGNYEPVASAGNRPERKRSSGVGGCLPFGCSACCCSARWARVGTAVAAHFSALHVTKVCVRTWWHLWAFVIHKESLMCFRFFSFQ